MEADVSLALSAARSAGELIRAAFGGATPVELKAGGEPVTAVDRAADRLLRETLGEARPEYGWVSEESAAEGERRERVWIVDPLDGTANFVAGRPEFAVSVGLVARGTAVLGVVYNPMSEEMYHAVRGGGAFCDGQAFGASRWPSGLAVLVASPAEIDLGEFRQVGDGWTVTALGSTALKMVAVARGTAQAYASPGRKQLWDVCGAAVVAEEVGAVVRDGAGAPLDYTLPAAPVNGIVVVAAGAQLEVPPSSSS
jgi:myo-inositol-1(or 4)-monophosphatase